MTRTSTSVLSIEIMLGVWVNDSDTFPEHGVCHSRIHQQHSVARKLCFSRDAVCWTQSQAHPAPQLPSQMSVDLHPSTGDQRFFPQALKMAVIHHLITLLSLEQEGTVPEAGYPVVPLLQPGEETPHHFLLGNDRMPKEIAWSLTCRTARPLNLFQYLAQETAIHTSLRSYEIG